MSQVLLIEVAAGRCGFIVRTKTHPRTIVAVLRQEPGIVRVSWREANQFPQRLERRDFVWPVVEELLVARADLKALRQAVEGCPDCPSEVLGYLKQIK